MTIRTFFSLIGFVCLFFLSPLFVINASGYGSMGTIAAAFGERGFFCAIDAGGKQEVICWNRDKNDGSPAQSAVSGYVPAMASLAGGEEFLCGITSNNSLAFCWNLLNPSQNLVPEAFQFTSYSQIAAGKNHVCAVSGIYFLDTDFGHVDCWEYNRTGGGSNFTSVAIWNSPFHDPKIDGIMMKNIVSGDGFSCGVTKDDQFVCWGPKSSNLGFPDKARNFDILASGRNSLCGVSNTTSKVKCFGNSTEHGTAPEETRFVSLSAGAAHFCGIRKDDHGVSCWGRDINSSSVPKSAGFVAIASSDYTTCGVREFDLVLDCWDLYGQSKPAYRPPLQLCSPGLCTPRSCENGWFSFNASNLNEPELTNLCSIHDLRICLPCGSNCTDGYFTSSTCNANADRVCTSCSLCQNKSCWDICKLPSSMREKQHQQHEQTEIHKLVIIIGCSILGFLAMFLGLFLIPRMIKGRRTQEETIRMQCCFRAGKRAVEADPDSDPQFGVTRVVSLGETQIFRLSELKDATHGFKEFNELGRGSFGFVYKAVLSDGRQVAVKRANAATIIHTNNRDFEAELEVLSKIRHINIVNLLGYCSEMGERVLVYEYMPHGTLYSHLHGDLSPLDWSMRLKISLQAARGIDYLHNEVDPPIVHRDIKTSNILLDSEMSARIADFGLLSASERGLNDSDMEFDVYNFGIVLLEILSGRKDYDRELSPSGIVEWGLPLIRNGKAAAIIDKNVALPRNFEPLLKLADLAELALRENPKK